MSNYAIYCDCNNCKFRGEVIIPFAEEVREAKCPICGCTSLFAYSSGRMLIDLQEERKEK